MIFHPVISEIAARRTALQEAVLKGRLSSDVGRYAQPGWAYVYKDQGTPSLAYARAGNQIDYLASPDQGALAFVVTTDDEDRDGDVVRPLGGQLYNYSNNPLVFFGHQEWEVPIGVCRSQDGRITVYPEENRMVDVIYFDLDDPDADFVFQKCRRKILNATSIAFVPIEAWRRDNVLKARTHNEQGGQPGWYFNIWDKTEVSIVGVPSNPKAVGLEKDLQGACRDCWDQEKSFMSPKLQKAWKPYCAVAKGCWNGWCPVPVEKAADIGEVDRKLAVVGDELRQNTDPAPMPRYGQIFVNDSDVGGQEAQAWYVGGDGDEDGFSKIVEDKIRRAFPGVSEVIYEAESFPPKDGGWRQVYPEQKPWTKQRKSACSCASCKEGKACGCKATAPAATVSKPFAGYTDFDDCVSKNQDKSDPSAYCAAIMRQVEGKAVKAVGFSVGDKVENVYSGEAGTITRIGSARKVGVRWDSGKETLTPIANVRKVGETKDIGQADIEGPGIPGRNANPEGAAEQEKRGKALEQSSGRVGGYVVPAGKLQADGAGGTRLDVANDDLGWKTCMTCVGTGSCKNCGGSGSVKLASGESDDCDECGGSGDCPECGGEGHVSKKEKQNSAGRTSAQIAPQAMDIVGQDKSDMGVSQPTVPQVLAALYSHYKAEAAYVDQLNDTYKGTLSGYRDAMDKRAEQLKQMYDDLSPDGDIEKDSSDFESDYDKAMESTGPEDTTEPGEAGLVEQGQIPPETEKAAGRTAIAVSNADRAAFVDDVRAAGVTILASARSSEPRDQAEGRITFQLSGDQVALDKLRANYQKGRTMRKDTAPAEGAYVEGDKDAAAELDSGAAPFNKMFLKDAPELGLGDTPGTPAPYNDPVPDGAAVYGSDTDAAIIADDPDDAADKIDDVAGAPYNKSARRKIAGGGAGVYGQDTDGAIVKPDPADAADKLDDTAGAPYNKDAPELDAGAAPFNKAGGTPGGPGQGGIMKAGGVCMCGTEIPGDADSCPGCGAPVQKDDYGVTGGSPASVPSPSAGVMPAKDDTTNPPPMPDARETDPSAEEILERYRQPKSNKWATRKYRVPKQLLPFIKYRVATDGKKYLVQVKGENAQKDLPISAKDIDTITEKLARSIDDMKKIFNDPSTPNLVKLGVKGIAEQVWYIGKALTDKGKLQRDAGTDGDKGDGGWGGELQDRGKVQRDGDKDGDKPAGPNRELGGGGKGSLDSVGSQQGDSPKKGYTNGHLVSPEVERKLLETEAMMQRLGVF